MFNPASPRCSTDTVTCTYMIRLSSTTWAYQVRSSLCRPRTAVIKVFVKNVSSKPSDGSADVIVFVKIAKSWLHTSQTNGFVQCDIEKNALTFRQTAANSKWLITGLELPPGIFLALVFGTPIIGVDKGFVGKMAQNRTWKSCKFPGTQLSKCFPTNVASVNAISKQLITYVTRVRFDIRVNAFVYSEGTKSSCVYSGDWNYETLSDKCHVYKVTRRYECVCVLPDCC